MSSNIRVTKLSSDEKSSVRNHLQQHKGKKMSVKGLKFGQGVTYQGGKYFIYDYDADRDSPGGVTLNLVDKGLTKLIGGVTIDSINESYTSDKDQMINEAVWTKKLTTAFGAFHQALDYEVKNQAIHANDAKKIRKGLADMATAFNHAKANLSTNEDIEQTRDRMVELNEVLNLPVNESLSYSQAEELGDKLVNLSKVEIFGVFKAMYYAATDSQAKMINMQAKGAYAYAAKK